VRTHGPDELVAVAVGDVFEVHLEGVPTSGYVWEVTVHVQLRDVVELLNSKTNAPEPSAPGGQATQTFRFRAAGPGEGRLLFRYRRSWEKTAAREHRVHVRVGERGSHPS
jgi:predicted secreted protein